MSKILVIRHSQASFMAEDYDQISELGEQQALALGEYFVRKNIVFDKVFTGELKRHEQTANGVKSIFEKNNIAFPEMTKLPEWDEHQGPEIVKHYISKMEQAGELDDLFYSENQRVRFRYYFEIFQKITRRWAMGDLDLSATDFHLWQTFKQQVHVGLEKVKAATKKGETIAVFTSGGPAAVTTGLALDLQDKKTIELSWQIDNTAVTEFLFSKNQFTLKTFNGVGHLEKAGMVTSI